MFTGLIQSLGTVVERKDLLDGSGVQYRFSVIPTSLGAGEKYQMGESIAVDGICLTVMQLDDDGFVAQLSPETLNKTTAGYWKKHQTLHFERALRIGDPIGGHLVSGHVDGIVKRVDSIQDGDFQRLRFAAPSELLPFLVTKGSVAIDGVSLTVNACAGSEFEVMLVPHTLANTHLNDPGRIDANIEIDMLARYVERQLDARNHPSG